MLATEASGFLVGSAVFKTVEGATSSLAGSIPVRLRDEKTREGPSLAGDPAFDVVVVGAGAAGCVVAARLAERASRSVALIEAGPDLRTDIPEGLRDGWHMVPDFDWGYASEPDERAAVETLRRGKLVGGTSWVTRFAVRGSPADFDAWATLGNPGWSFEDVLPAFIALETDLDFDDRPWHGNAGPIPIGRYLDLEPTEIVAATLAAMEAVRVPARRGPQPTRRRRRRADADELTRRHPGHHRRRLPPPVGAPSNLTILPDVHVAEVVLEDVRATGVRLSDGSIVRAGWVVLSSGTYGSPPILLRSGIGPPDHLRSMGLPVRIELPGVGENLADHPARRPRSRRGREHDGRSAPACDRDVPQRHRVRRRSAGSDGVDERPQRRSPDVRDRCRPAQTAIAWLGAPALARPDGAAAHRPPRRARTDGRGSTPRGIPSSGGGRERSPAFGG